MSLRAYITIQQIKYSVTNFDSNLIYSKVFCSVRYSVHFNKECNSRKNISAFESVFLFKMLGCYL